MCPERVHQEWWVRAVCQVWKRALGRVRRRCEISCSCVVGFEEGGRGGGSEEEQRRGRPGALGSVRERDLTWML